MTNGLKKRVAIACQGGGSHTSFTAGVLQGLLGNLPGDVEVVAPERHVGRSDLRGARLGGPAAQRHRRWPFASCAISGTRRPPPIRGIESSIKY